MQSISGCHRAGVAYNHQVRLFWHLHCLALLAALPLVFTGCGGIQASKTVSPATFFMPTIMRVDPPVEATNLVAMASSNVR